MGGESLLLLCLCVNLFMKRSNSCCISNPNLRCSVHDFAGGAQVHIFGGLNGLVATLFLGPRLGRFDGSRPISDFFPSSVSSQCLGMLALWWGWIGFNCGSSFGITDDRWVVAIR